MNKTLKKAIIDFIINNEKEFQLTNVTTDKFRSYIYDTGGEYLIGGEDVKKFIDQSIELITNS